MTLTLESNEVNEDYVILQYFQIIDTKETADLTGSDCDGSDFDDGICFYYESLTCSFQYKDKILDGGVSIANSIIQGYKGVKEMKDGIGAFDQITILNKTSTYPWFIDYERSNVTKMSDAETRETKLLTTCSVFRDFVTDWSEIEIKGGMTLTGTSGYRLYTDDRATSPFAKGNSSKFDMLVLDQASFGMAVAASTLLLSAVL